MYIYINIKFLRLFKTVKRQIHTHEEKIGYNFCKHIYSRAHFMNYNYKL